MLSGATQMLGKLIKPTPAKGGERISRMLAAEGVEKVFGIIDGTYFGLVSTLGKHGIDLITPRHETSAVHMAGAYARLTGRLGVCIASNGPGVANALSGVAVEEAEGNRVLLITSSRRGQIAYPDRGGAYQYFPHVEVTRPMCKWAEWVPSLDRLPEMLRAALRAAHTGRPGVVHLDVPETVINADVEPETAPERSPSQYRALAPLAAPAEQVAQCAKMLREADRPLIHAGSGVMHALASLELERLAALVQAPVTTSWGARAALDERLPEAVPMIFTEAVKVARTEADVVLVLGSRLGETDWWGKAPYWATPAAQRLIQVDLDAAILGVNRPTDLAIQADLKAFLLALNDELARAPIDPKRAAPRREQLGKLATMKAERRAELDKKLAAGPSGASRQLTSAEIPPVAQEVFGDDAIFVIDGGNTAIWANFYHEVRRPGTLLGTPKMGMLGAGVSQALGAKVAFPDKNVYCLIGDGAMGFHQQEIETAVRCGLGVVWVVLCDKQWGMVKINQSFMLKPAKTLLLKSLGPDETINTDLSETAFDHLARSMGAHGERVSSPAGLRAALTRALEVSQTGKPVVVHCDVDPVAHMWAPDLKTFKDMHQEPAGR